MTIRPHEAGSFKKQLRSSMQSKSPPFTTVKVFKHENLYLLGDRAEEVYFIEAGQIKLLTFSPEGKECLTSIYTPGDTFGELCLAESSVRRETAMAMEDTTLRAIPCAAFFLHLGDHSLLEGFVRYLAVRIDEQQRIITHLITVDSEHRLGETLLELARKLGKQDPRSKRIEQRITHEELSQMVGTTRPRVTEFMQKFRRLGLIASGPHHYLIVNEKKLAEYLAEMPRDIRPVAHPIHQTIPKPV
jgi:CRP/FNR family cyclic AMP-dependent transcriptional regulator